MKKILFILLIVLISISSLLSNPVQPPQAFISELKFEGSTKWFLEINFQFSMPFRKSQYDSICIGTTSGFSRIRLDNIADNTNIFVITVDSLMSSLSLKIKGDYIKLYSFLSYQYPYRKPLIDSLFFGKYPGSTIDSLPPGYSIVRLSYLDYSKDKCPTIGLPNDTLGTCGILTGHMYDKYNNLITTGNFRPVSTTSLYNRIENPMTLHNDGSFSTNVYSRKIVFNKIINNYPLSEFQMVKIDSIELNVNPGELYEKDIRLLDTLIVGVEENKLEPDYKIGIMNYPNPFNPSTNFVITIPSSLKNTKKQINIYNVLGRKINNIIVSNQLHVQWDGKDYSGKAAASGIYYYQLVLDNRIYKSGSMILLK